MIRFTKILFVGVTITLLTSCKSDKFDARDITGTWYYIDRDTVYGEVIITPTRLWEYSHESGVWTSNYKIEGDSFKVELGNPNLNFERKSKDEFHLINKPSITRYYRLVAKIDTAGLIREDEDILDEYVKEWRDRKYTWELDHGKK